MDDNNSNSADEALRDYNVQVYCRDITPEELEDHRQRQMHCGIHLPFLRQRSHLSRRHVHHKEDEVFEEYGTPSQRVRNILDSPTDSHPLFIEMTELRWRYTELEWRETARWLRFEEHVEQGGKRWSKPYVATLSLYSVFETKSCLANGAVMLDVGANTMDELAEVLVDHLVNDGQLEVEFKVKMKELLLIRRHHLKEKRVEDVHSHEHSSSTNINAWTPNSHKFKVSGVQQTDPNLHNHAFAYTCEEKQKPSSTTSLKGNERFRRKMPDDIEAANIMIAEQNFLKNPFVAFVRLKHGVLLGDMAEVLIPTRFLFVMMAPEGYIEKIQAIGRTMGALMADEVFREVSYKSKNRQDILSGVDEFIESVTVLPPAEWDPKIRIEPPQKIPSQEERKKPPVESEDIDSEEDDEKIRQETGLVRTGRLFGGLYDDVKRKLPWYWSDFKDAFAIQSIAAILFLYFATLSPIITFGGLLDLATGGNIAVIESLVAAFISGILYGFFSGQPLTILNTTGPVLVFEAVTYVFCQEYGLYYLEFRCWIGIWAFLFMLLLVMFECSAYVCYITRFTEENFALLIALVYIYQAVEKMILIGEANPMETHPGENISGTCVPLEINLTTQEHNQTNLTNDSSLHTINDCAVTIKYVPDVLLFASVEFIGTFLFVIFLKSFRTTGFFPSKVRQILSDFAVIIAIALFTIIDDQLGLNIPKLYVPDSFTPTRSDRTWFIHPYLKNPWWCIPATIPPAMLATILIYMDQMITAVIINRKENKLKKGPGYHLDLLVLAITILISSLIGVPWLVAGTVVAITHVNALRMESEVAAPGEKPQFLGIRENRLTQICIFAMIGASVGMVTILTYIPMPVLFGIFMYMGTSPLSDMHFYQRLLLFLKPIKYQPDFPYLRHIRLWRVHMFTLIQLICMGALWVVKLTKAISIGFPFMLVIMVVVRKSLDWVYTQEELKLLDDVMPGARKKKIKTNEDGFTPKPRKFSVVPDKHPALDINLMEELMKIRKVSTNSITLNWMNGKYIPVDHCRTRTGIIDEFLPEENTNLLPTPEEEQDNGKSSQLENDSKV